MLLHTADSGCKPLQCLCTFGLEGQSQANGIALCSALTAKGVPCSMVGVYEGVCYQHADQALLENSHPDPEKAVRARQKIEDRHRRAAEILEIQHRPDQDGRTPGGTAERRPGRNDQLRAKKLPSLKGLALGASGAVLAIVGAAVGLGGWWLYWTLLPGGSPWGGKWTVLRDGTLAQTIDPWDTIAFFVSMLAMPGFLAFGVGGLGWLLPRGIVDAKDKSANNP
jgi:hypothetical protein